MKQIFTIGLLSCVLLGSAHLAHAEGGPEEGHFWDEVVFTSLPSGGNEKVKVHAKLTHTQSGRPAFELLVITIGNQELKIPQELTKAVDFPNLRSFLLMSERKAGVRTIWLSVSPQWKGDQGKPKFTFEISNGELRSLIKSTGGKNETLYRAG